MHTRQFQTLYGLYVIQKLMGARKIHQREKKMSCAHREKYCPFWGWPEKFWGWVFWG